MGPGQAYMVLLRLELRLGTSQSRGRFYLLSNSQWISPSWTCLEPALELSSSTISFSKETHRSFFLLYKELPNSLMFLMQLFLATLMHLTLSLEDITYCWFLFIPFPLLIFQECVTEPVPFLSLLLLPLSELLTVLFTISRLEQIMHLQKNSLASKAELWIQCLKKPSPPLGLYSHNYISIHFHINNRNSVLFQLFCINLIFLSKLCFYFVMPVGAGFYFLNGQHLW